MPNSKLGQLLLAITVSGSVYGFTGFDSHLLQLNYIDSGQQLAVIHPYLDDNRSRLPRFALYRHRLVDLAGYGELLLREAGLSYGVEIVTERKDRRLVDYRYRWHGYDVCDLRASIHALRHDNQLYRQGQLPDIIGQHGEVFVWPHLDDIQWLVEETFPADSQVRVVASKRCLLNSNHGLLPVYDLTVQVDNLIYEVRVASDEVLSVNSRFFHVQGEFFVYPENSIASETRKKFYIEVDGSGYLRNSNFETAVYGKNNRLREQSNVFNYQDGDKRMPEVSTFAHANLMLEWFRSLGYQWQGEPLLIEVHANRSEEEIHAPIKQFPNNALYMPEISGSTSQARIMLGDGDGVILRDLSLDGDVISHELGHHVIYRRLTETKGQSLVIHEGLADYFTFAKTSNACLAESVCPDDSPVCQRNRDDKLCLRVGDHQKDYAYLNSFGSPHITGQVLSAFLWDLRNDSDIPGNKVDRIAFEAINYLQWNSNLRGFIEAILLADYQLYQGDNCSTILAAAVNRGLAEFANNLECNENTPKVIEYNRASATTHNETTLLHDDSQDSCGTIASASMGNNSPLYVLLLIISPLLFVVFLRILGKNYRINLSSR